MEFKEKGTINIPIQYKSFIYFLIKENEVVYVGQTKNNLARPFSHKDKDFDRVEILLCNEELLDFVENKYIIKYQPKYNTRINDGYKLITARNKLRAILHNDMTIRDVKNVLKELDLKTIKVGSNDYVTNEHLMKIHSYIVENNGKY